MAADSDTCEPAVRSLLAAIESRDVRAIEDAVAPTATWQNVPSPPTVGRDAVARLLGDIVTWSDEVRWDVVTAAFGPDTAWVERVDRFVIDGVEHAVRCNGVVRVADGVVVEVRDYVDLGEWHSRVASALDAMENRAPETVVGRHLDGVRALDPIRMAADYCHDAVLIRPDGERRGRRAIADYFWSVPDRLGEGRVEFGPISRSADASVVVPWSIDRPGVGPITGADTYVIRAGRITRQTVQVDTADF